MARLGSEPPTAAVQTSLPLHNQTTIFDLSGYWCDCWLAADADPGIKTAFAGLR